MSSGRRLNLSDEASSKATSQSNGFGCFCAILSVSMRTVRLLADSSMLYLQGADWLSSHSATSRR